jgi:hypothetical protein
MVNSEQSENKILNHEQYKAALRFLGATHAGMARHLRIDVSTSFKYAKGTYAVPKRISDMVNRLVDGLEFMEPENLKQRRRITE